jgi:F-type H+-transporting ATPase subunit epsilon
MPLDVSVVTPDREVWSGDASFVVARSEGGEIGVLPGHAPFLGALRHSQLKIVPVEGEPLLLAAHGGFVEVFSDRVTILTPVSELSSEIDVERARRAKERADQALEDEAAREALLRAETRLKTAAEAGLIVG